MQSLSKARMYWGGGLCAVLVGIIVVLGVCHAPTESTAQDTAESKRDDRRAAHTKKHAAHHDAAVKRRQTFWSHVGGFAHTILFGTLGAPFTVLNWLLSLVSYAGYVITAMIVIFLLTLVILTVKVFQWLLYPRSSRSSK